MCGGRDYFAIVISQHSQNVTARIHHYNVPSPQNLFMNKFMAVLSVGIYKKLVYGWVGR